MTHAYSQMENIYLKKKKNELITFYSNGRNEFYKA